MQGPTANTLLALAFALAGCLAPVQEAGWGTCPEPATARLDVAVEGNGTLRHVMLVSGTAFRTSLDCSGPEARPDRDAAAGRVSAEVGLLAYQEVRLFFEDGTLRLGVDLPASPSLDLVASRASPPTLTNHGSPVAIARHEWLQGPDAGRDTYHGVGNVPLQAGNETMTVVVASAWNEGLRFQASISYDPYVDPATLGDGGGRIHVRVLAPNGTVASLQEVAEPQGYADIALPPGVAPGAWRAEFRYVPSTTTETRMLSSVSAWLVY